MIYQLFTKTENTDWNKQMQTMNKLYICLMVQDYQESKKIAIKNNNLIIDFKVVVM